MGVAFSLIRKVTSQALVPVTPWLIRDETGRIKSVHGGSWRCTLFSKEKTMTDRERLRSLAEADNTTLELIDQVLLGESPIQATETGSLALLTLTETAKRMNLSRVTIYRLVRKGALKVVSLNGTRRVKLQSVLDFLNGRAA